MDLYQNLYHKWWICIKICIKNDGFYYRLGRGEGLVGRDELSTQKKAALSSNIDPSFLPMKNTLEPHDLCACFSINYLKFGLLRVLAAHVNDRALESSSIWMQNSSFLMQSSSSLTQSSSNIIHHLKMHNSNLNTGGGLWAVSLLRSLLKKRPLLNRHFAVRNHHF